MRTTSQERCQTQGVKNRFVMTGKTYATFLWQNIIGLAEVHNNK